MSSFFNRIFSTRSSKSSGSNNNNKNNNNDDNINGNNNNNNNNNVSKNMNEAARKKLLRRMALAQNDPEPLLDLSDSELTKVDEQILSLIKVYRKRRIHFERNRLRALVFERGASHMIDVHFLHVSDNQIRSFQLDAPDSLINLKELYLDGNELRILPDALFDLPQLRALSVRRNRLAEFPLSIERLRSLAYCDLAFNQIGELPRRLLTLDSPPSLRTVIIAGNPLSLPVTFDALLASCDADERDISEFDRLKTALWRSYADFDSFDCDAKQSKNNFDLNQSTQSNEPQQQQLKSEKDKLCNLNFNRKICHSNDVRSQPNINDDDDDDDDDEDHDIVDDHFARYTKRKLESKQNALEFERQYLATQLLAAAPKRSNGCVNAAPDSAANLPTKDFLLNQLRDEQRALFRKINQFQDRKEAEKQKMLDDYIEMLQQHSSLLIEKIRHDNNSTFDDDNDNDIVVERDLCAKLDADIRRLLAKYDDQVRAKRDEVLSTIAVEDAEAGAKLAQSVQRKDDQHQHRFRELEKQEESLAKAFAAIIDDRDRRNATLTASITMIERELLALTFVERKRKNERSDERLTELLAQRQKLAQLLASLLAEKRTREKRLKVALENEFAKRFSISDDEQFGDSLWLAQFQRLLDAQPFETQIAQYGVDARVGCSLIRLYRDLADDRAFPAGSILQRKLAYYLGHFADLRYERLRLRHADDLMQCGIDDYELCRLIAERFRQDLRSADDDDDDDDRNRLSIGEEKLKISKADNSICVVLPKLDQKTDNDDEESSSSSSSSSNEEAKIDENGGKFWCEAECVICLDNKSNIVFLPCGHICTCQRCIRPNACTLSLCPLCRAEIDSMQCIHFSSS